MTSLTLQELRQKFKEMYQDEFDDPNESFTDFLLDLIPRDILFKLLCCGKNYYMRHFYKYK